MKKIAFILSLGICLLFSGTVNRAQEGMVVFPPLTGIYPVGQVSYDMADTSREEIYTEDESDSREFAITVFYPVASSESGEQATYVDAELIAPLVNSTGMPAFVWEALKPHSIKGAPVADGVFPIILFSHGSGLPIQAYTGQMEDLASHGYIVVGISHTYDSPVVALSDGRILNAEDGTLLNAEYSLTSVEEAIEFYNNNLAVWVADIQFVIDELERLNTDDNLLSNHLDLARIGAMGHSFGGAAAFETAYHDERILAVVNMDGSLFGDVLEYGLSRPAMILAQDVISLADQDTPPDMVTEEFETYKNERESVLSNATPGYSIIVPGASHGTFVTDVLIIADAFPIFAVPDLVGAVEDFEVARSNIHTTALAFFNTYLEQDSAPQIYELNFEGFEITYFNLEQ